MLEKWYQQLLLGCYLVAWSVAALYVLVVYWPSSEVITAAEAEREVAAARAEAKAAEKAVKNATEAEGVAKTEVKKPDQVANPDEVAKATKVLDDEKNNEKDAELPVPKAQRALADPKTTEQERETAKKYIEAEKTAKEKVAAAEKNLAAATEKRTAAEKNLAAATEKRTAAEKNPAAATEKRAAATEKRAAAEKKLAQITEWADVSEKISAAVDAIEGYEAEKHTYPASVPHVYRDAQAGKTSQSRILLLIIAAATLGSCIHAIKSFYDFAGNRLLKSSWLPWYLLRPFPGMMLAILFYLVFWGGSHHDDSIASSNDLFWIIGVAGLVGLFSKQATDKLDEVFSSLVKSSGDDKRKDKLDPDNLPHITRVVATKRDQDSGVVTLNVYGDHFTAGAVVRWNGSERTTKFTNANQLVAELLAEDVYQPGEIELQVVNPEPAGGESSFYSVTVHPGPRITEVKLAAENCETGDGVAKISVKGERFVAGANVECDKEGKEGAVRETKFISPTELHAYLRKPDRTTGEPSQVRVVNPLPGGDPSPWFPINTLPKITDLQWKPVDGKEEVTLVVKGSNFVNGFRLWYAGKEKTKETTFVSGNELHAQLVPEDYKTAGFYRVKVCNPDPVGGAVEFAKPNPVPTVTGVEPAEAKTRTPVRLTITGSHYIPQTYVLLGEKPLTPEAGTRTETRLTVALNEADTTTVGEFSVTVVNPDPGGGRAESPQRLKVTS